MLAWVLPTSIYKLIKEFFYYYYYYFQAVYTATFIHSLLFDVVNFHGTYYIIFLFVETLLFIFRKIF